MNRGSKIFVKEYPPNLTVEMVQAVLKPGFIAYPYRDGDRIGDAPLIVRAEEKERYQHGMGFAVVYEELMEELQTCLVTEYKKNYPYYYLRSAMIRAGQPDIHTIIAGNSYFVFGLEASMMGGAVNCSIASQDLYYSFQALRYAYERNNSIRTVIFGGGVLLFLF